MPLAGYFAFFFFFFSHSSSLNLDLFKYPKMKLDLKNKTKQNTSVQPQCSEHQDIQGTQGDTKGEQSGEKEH